ncbi:MULTISPECIES: restriction endonuclease subunit S [unclassified Pseudoalteromonas]|uniref:restriction endonuclease subunit S n=1 Tax=unclassified Pseudoalteromonas TaxID=194690 RepID=UPI003326DFAF
MVEVKDVPRLKFKGFSGIWDSRALGDVASFYKGKGLPKSAIQGDGLFPCIHYGELFTNYSEVIETVTSKTNQNDNFVSICNDVLMPTSDVTPKGLVKSCCVKQSGVVLGGDILVIRPNDQDIIDGEFLSRFIRTREQQVLQNVTGSTVFHLYASSIEKLDVAFPSIEQQKAIGTFFKNLDNQITLKQHKLDKLITLKKAMLEKIFPKEGADEPEIRFKSFSGIWDSRVLGDVASFYKGKGLPKSAIQDDGLFPCIHYGELFTNYSEVIETVTSKTNQNDNFVSICNDVLMPTSDVTPKGLVKSCCVKQSSVVLGGDILVIRPNDQDIIDGEFLSRFIRTREQQVLQNVTGSTVFHLYASSIEKLDIVFPSIGEQKAIGSYFKSLDNLISLQKTELTKLKQIKSSYLEKMFV